MEKEARALGNKHLGLPRIRDRGCPTPRVDAQFYTRGVVGQKPTVCAPEEDVPHCGEGVQGTAPEIGTTKAPSAHPYTPLCA